MQKVKLLPIIRSLISTRGWVGCSGGLFLMYLPKPRYHAKSKLNSATLLSNLFFLLFFSLYLYIYHSAGPLLILESRHEQ